MTVLTQNLILSQQQTLYSSHQRTTFTCQVGSSFTDKSRFKQISGTYTDTQCDGSLHSSAGSILIDGIRRVQSATFKEHRTE